MSGASVVIASMGDILAEDAPLAARRLVAMLANFSEFGTIGEAVRATRRELLAEGHGLALLLIAHGDADWRLGGRDAAPGDVVR